MRRVWEWITLWFAIITLVIAVTILTTFVTYPLLAQYENLPAIAGMTLGRLYHNYAVLLGYLHFPWVAHLQMPDFPTSASAAHHFADVKHLFLLNLGVLLVTSPFAVRFWLRLRQHAHRYQLVRPFQIGAVVPIILTALLAMNFDQFFVTFHEVLFRNSDWLFDPATDPIINVLPESFFLICFLFAFGLFEAVMFWGIHQGRSDARTH